MHCGNVAGASSIRRVHRWDGVVLGQLRKPNRYEAEVTTSKQTVADKLESAPLDVTHMRKVLPIQASLCALGMMPLVTHRRMFT